ncbi:dipeptidase [Sphingosinicella sp. CPCC 101087]|uniref:dipeptidase n=1 Tax=Sphingosinicella sp. CPCC 101087 TaxID=2497754 RepID=UPI00101CFB1F|nr:membrane dipeptidase [Sphingosinicella sp. CPCC 101087]
MNPNRRRLLMGAAATGLLAFPMINIGRYAVAGASERTYSARAIALVERSLVVDMLFVPRIDFSPAGHSRPLSAQEIADFRASGINVMHNAVGVGSRSSALEFLAAQQGLAGRHPDLFELVDTAEDLDRANDGRRIAMIMGLQNASPFESIEDVATFHSLGLRCAQLTYNNQNRIGSGSTDRADGGVSSYGAEIVAAMNAAGMLVDVSHCGDRTTLDAIELSRQPIAITHSNCRALAEHPRNKSDEAIRALAAKDGVMGITGVRMFVRTEEPTDIGHMADHIEHVARLVGIEHVGIGSDADLNGYDDMPPDQYEQLKGAYTSAYAFREKIDTDGFDHPRKVYDLTEELIRRGHSDADIALILGGNFRRLLGAVWGARQPAEAPA